MIDILKRLENSEVRNSDFVTKIQNLDQEISDKERLNELKSGKLGEIVRELEALKEELSEKTEIIRGYEKKRLRDVVDSEGVIGGLERKVNQGRLLGDR